MKKILSLVLSLAMLLTLTLTLAGCGEDDGIKVGYMQGPTGMGMAKLIHDNGGLDNGNEKYSFNKYTDTTSALIDLGKGAADIICLPTNEAANHYNGNYDNLTVLAINTLGSVYVIAKDGTTLNSFADLEGKTIYTCLKGTPRMILEYLLSEAGVNATILTEHDGNVINTPEDLKNTLVSKDGIDIAVAPEPIVTAVTSNKPFSVAVNLNDVWNEYSDAELAMGCVVTTKEFLSKNKKAVDDFLSEYRASIEFVNDAANVDTAADYIVEAGIMQAAGAAKKALNNLRGSIAYLDGADMKSALVGFYQAMGIALPNNEFYYEK